MNEYVVILERVPNAKGPYSERQAREVVEKSAPETNAKMMRLVRPVWWMPEDDDLPRFQSTNA